jgi:hypothetical protein
VAKQRRWLRWLGWLTAIGLGGVAALWWLVIPRWARPTEREHPVLTPEERAAEEQRLRDLGFRVPADGLFLERPFEPPWTSRSLLVPASWEASGLKEFLGQRASVRADLLLEDLDVLEAVMSRAYGGWDSAAARGWDWDRWFGDWRTRLRGAGTRRLSADDAFAPVDALLRFQLDNHTQIPLGLIGSMSFSQTALLARVPAAPCTEVRGANGTFALAPGDAATGVRRARVARRGGGLVEAAYVVAPNARGALHAVHCGDAWIDLDVVSRGQTALLARALLPELFGRERPVIRALSAEVALARLPTMVPSAYAHVDEDRSKWPRPGAEKALVVDLRGNGGYSAALGLDVLRDWIPRERLPAYDAIIARVGTSCLAAPLGWGRDRQVLHPPISDRTRAGIQRELDALALETPPGCPRDVRETEGTVRYREHRLHERVGHRIVALVDNGCGSDCEGLVALLATMRETVVVGVNTAGVGQFIQPGYSLLPHTGLPYRIALGRSDMYGDGRSFDGYGLDVDVVLPHPESWGDADLARLGAELAAW